MVPTVFSMAKLIKVKRRGLVIAVVIAAISVMVGCGGATPKGSNEAASASRRVLSASETIQLLHELPYRYVFRHVRPPKGAKAAVAGRAVGAHHTVLNFGIALGRHTTGVPVPRAGVSEVTYFPDGGFVYTDDLEVPGEHEKWEPGPQFHTAAQWHEAGHMGVEIREHLCLKATNKVCPIGGG
jgi:hypothetical protein